jgi:hypothetical protein
MIASPLPFLATSSIQRPVAVRPLLIAPSPQTLPRRGCRSCKLLTSMSPQANTTISSLLRFDSPSQPAKQWVDAIQREHSSTTSFKFWTSPFWMTQLDPEAGEVFQGFVWESPNVRVVRVGEKHCIPTRNSRGNLRACELPWRFLIVSLHCNTSREDPWALDGGARGMNEKEGAGRVVCVREGGGE